MPKKKCNKNKSIIGKRKLNIETKDNENINNFQKLDSQDYIIKDIYPDGNCFYRSISYFYRETEEDYAEFREMITLYMEKNIDSYINYIALEELNIENEDIDNEDLIKAKKIQYLQEYIDTAKNNGTYAGDIEISTSAILFGCNIRIYTQGNNCYNLLNEFNNQNPNDNIYDKDIINLLFINNNHFQLLMKKNYKKNTLINNIIKTSNLKDLFKNITNSNSRIILEKDKDSIIKQNKYVNYHRENCKNYYNEIFDY